MKELFNRYLIDKKGVITSKITRDLSKGKQKIIQPFYDKDGYKRVSLITDEGRKKFRVCRLVALAYVPNPDNKPFVNHINGIKNDDNFENLEWVTASENKIHALNIGLETRNWWTYKVYDKDKFVFKGNSYKACQNFIKCGKSSVQDAIHKGYVIFKRYTIIQTYNYS